MQHIDELTLMMFIDQELTNEEVNQVNNHLMLCTHCQQLSAQMQADQTLLIRTFAQPPEVNLTIPFNPLTSAQIEAIATLHKRQNQHHARHVWSWIGLGVITVLVYFLFVESDLFQWFANIWSAWQYNFFWTSAFWITESASDLITQPQTNLMAIFFLFLLMLGTLLLLNTRHPLSFHGEDSEKGDQK